MEGQDNGDTPPEGYENLVAYGVVECKAGRYSLTDIGRWTLSRAVMKGYL